MLFWFSSTGPVIPENVINYLKETRLKIILMYYPFYFPT